MKIQIEVELDALNLDDPSIHEEFVRMKTIEFLTEAVQELSKYYENQIVVDLSDDGDESICNIYGIKDIR